MKKITKLVSSLVIGGMIVATQAQATEDMKVYVGAGVGYSMLEKNDNVEIFNTKNLVGANNAQMSAANIVANNAFKKSSNHSFNGNVFAGVKFNQYFGVEVGYSRLFNAPEIKLNERLDQDIPDTLVKAKGQISQSNIYADVLGYYPIADRTNLIGSLGIARVSTSVKYKADNDASEDAKTVVNNLNKENINSTNQIQPRIGVGVGYDVTDNVSVRGMLRYQSSGLFSSSNKDEAKKELYKGATSFNVEVAYTF